jgi:predicted RNA-binding Zn ribbon-like protein
MTGVMSSRSSFEFTAGSVCLDFVDTVAHRPDRPRDLLSSPERLTAWFGQAGLGTVPAALATERQLRDARELREAIHRAAGATILGAEPTPLDLERINRHARAAPPRPQFIDGEVVWTAKAGIEAGLSAIAADAVLRLAPDQRARLRACPACSMQFFDNSRPGKRKWCSSQSGCGNREKVQRHRAARFGERDGHGG